MDCPLTITSTDAVTSFLSFHSRVSLLTLRALVSSDPRDTLSAMATLISLWRAETVLGHQKPTASHAYHVTITWSSCVHHMCIMCISHVHRVYITCSSCDTTYVHIVLLSHRQCEHHNTSLWSQVYVCTYFISIKALSICMRCAESNGREQNIWSTYMYMSNSISDLSTILPECHLDPPYLEDHLGL